MPSVAAWRLAAQRLAPREHRDPAALVSWMGAMQAQDPAAARWAVGMRLAGRAAGEAAIARALDEGSVIRTHVMRWTWQLVAPADLHWMLPLVGPEVIRRAARRFRELDLDEATFRRSRTVLERALRDGAHATRDELAAALQAAGISVADGRRLSHLLGRAELEGLICSGAARGKSATFALLESRAAPPKTPWPREQALAELARRYFRSRGPATLADFVWWSGLPPAQARAALESVRDQLAHVRLEGADAWRDPEQPAAPGPALADAYLVPPFDELLIAYKDRAAVLEPAHARRMNAGGGMLPGAVLLGGRVVASWRRTLARDQVAIRVEPFTRMTARGQEQVRRAADRYARFLGLEAAVAFAA
jgi:hypothetical protein